MAAMEVVLFIGLQASGKSTFYRTRFVGTHGHISKDNFRNAKNRERRQQRLMKAALSQGHSVVVDNTNPTLEARGAAILLAHEFGARVIGYYFEPDVKASLERNEQRQGAARVPDIAIFATARKLVSPSYEEGFGQLFLVRASGEVNGEYQFEVT